MVASHPIYESQTEDIYASPPVASDENRSPSQPSEIERNTHPQPLESFVEVADFINLVAVAQTPLTQTKQVHNVNNVHQDVVEYIKLEFVEETQQEPEESKHGSASLHDVEP